jgi:hypothetical protein
VVVTATGWSPAFLPSAACFRQAARSAQDSNRLARSATAKRSRHEAEGDGTFLDIDRVIEHKPPSLAAVP